MLPPTTLPATTTTAAPTTILSEAAYFGRPRLLAEPADGAGDDADGAGRAELRHRAAVAEGPAAGRALPGPRPLQGEAQQGLRRHGEQDRVPGWPQVITRLAVALRCL